MQSLINIASYLYKEKMFPVTSNQHNKLQKTLARFAGGGESSVTPTVSTLEPAKGTAVSAATSLFNCSPTMAAKEETSLETSFIPGLMDNGIYTREEIQIIQNNLQTQQELPEVINSLKQQQSHNIAVGAKETLNNLEIKKLAHEMEKARLNFNSTQNWQALIKYTVDQTKFTVITVGMLTGAYLVASPVLLFLGTAVKAVATIKAAAITAGSVTALIAAQPLPVPPLEIALGTGKIMLTLKIGYAVVGLFGTELKESLLKLCLKK